MTTKTNPQPHAGQETGGKPPPGHAHAGMSQPSPPQCRAPAAQAKYFLHSMRLILESRPRDLIINIQWLPEKRLGFPPNQPGPARRPRGRNLKMTIARGGQGGEGHISLSVVSQASSRETGSITKDCERENAWNTFIKAMKATPVSYAAPSKWSSPSTAAIAVGC